MKSPWRIVVAFIIGTQLLSAQNPSVAINNAPSGFTLIVTNAGGIGQLDVTTFAVYVNGADMTAAFVAFVTSGSPIVTITTTSTSIVIFIAANLTANNFAARVCTFGGLCGAHNVVLESFDDSTHRDTTFVQTFGPQQARWNDPSAPSQLAGRAISGSPTGTTPAALGTRIQFVVDPQPNTVAPAGLFSPFDASAANSAGLCGAGGCNYGANSNPNGGSHIMHVYEAAELSNYRDSLEQIEWSPSTGVTAQSVYPNYKIWCGLTSTAAPIAGGAVQGLSSVFDVNYNLTPYQAGMPLPSNCAAPNARKVSCGLATPYVVPLGTTTFFPFPTLNPCFDFATSTGGSGAGVNLLVEQDIDPGMQVPNFNRFRATAFMPVRRLIDKPISLVSPGLCPFNSAGGTFDIYKMRFTFVGLVAQGRSLWYDTGLTNPNYLSFIVTPPVSAQPFGTQSTWILEGTDTLNPGPGTTGIAATYINAAGVTFPTVLSTTISQLRFFRFRLELRGNNVANSTPAYTSVGMVYF